MRALMLIGLLWLSGCAGLPPSERAEWEQHRAQLAALTDWTASGKLAVRSGEQSATANLNWLQLGRHSHLELSGPLGFQATRIHSDGEQLHVTRGDEQTRFDLSRPGALRAYTGWDLPVQSLSWWLRGLPAPHSRAGTDIEGGLLRTLRQDGWTIHYSNYQHTGAFALPGRLELERGDTGARLIIRRWQAGSA